GKLWGIIDSSRPYLASYLLLALACSLFAGLLAPLAVLFFWAWAWLLMYYMGAAGIHSSARADNSWRSLFTTMTSNVGLVVLIYLTLGVAAALTVTWIVIVPVLMLLDLHDDVGI